MRGFSETTLCILGRDIVPLPLYIANSSFNVSMNFNQSICHFNLTLCVECSGVLLESFLISWEFFSPECQGHFLCRIIWFWWIILNISGHFLPLFKTVERWQEIYEERRGTTFNNGPRPDLNWGHCNRVVGSYTAWLPKCQLEYFL